MGDFRLLDWILLLFGIGAVLNGGFMLVTSEAWFERVAAHTGPFNLHLVKDVGAAYVAAGVACMWAARIPAWRLPLTSCALVFIGLHGLIHLLEFVRGVQPAAHLLQDLPGVFLPVLLLAIVVVRTARGPLTRD